MLLIAKNILNNTYKMLSVKYMHIVYMYMYKSNEYLNIYNINDK